MSTVHVGFEQIGVREDCDETSLNKAPISLATKKAFSDRGRGKEKLLPKMVSTCC